MRRIAAVREKLQEQQEQLRKQQQSAKPRSNLDIVMDYVYDRGDEVLRQAMAQYPAQTTAIVAKIVELIRSGELTNRISGGELLALFRSIGLPVRIDTSIKIEDHGKLVSFSDRLKHLDDDVDNDDDKP
jgi:DNA-binding TFAR19-related protein (PDSD5 family)